MMFFKVIIFITICAVDSRSLLSELKSEQEIPALRYKYAKLDHYSALNSILRFGRSAHPNLFQELQYAPLYEGIRWKNKKENADEVNTLDTPSPTATSDPMENTEFIRDGNFLHLNEKSHLEPRPAKGTKFYASRNRAATAVSRSPGHNVVYKIFPESIPTEPERKPIKIVDYVKPIGINLKLESFTSTIAPPDLPSEKVGRHLELSKQQYVINPIEHFVISPKAIINKRYLPHTKYHRLHLNIARVYSPGQLPQERPRLRTLYAGNFGRRSKYAQAYVPQAYKDLSLAHNTVLHPVKNRRKTYHLRTSIEVLK